MVGERGVKVGALSLGVCLVVLSTIQTGICLIQLCVLPCYESTAAWELLMFNMGGGLLSSGEMRPTPRISWLEGRRDAERHIMYTYIFKLTPDVIGSYNHMGCSAA